MDTEPDGPHTTRLLVTMSDNAKTSVPTVVKRLEERMPTIQNAEAHYLLSQSSLGSIIGGEKAAIVIEIRGRNLQNAGFYRKTDSNDAIGHG